MRYRLKDYKITIEGNNVDVHFNVPEGDDWMVADPVKEAIRLIVDETAGIIFCSSMQKDKIIGCSSSSETGYNWKARFAIPTGKTVSINDKFTVEMDFGEAPRDLATSAEVEAIDDKVGAKDSSNAAEPSTLFAWFRRLYQNIQSVRNNVYDAQNTKSAVSEAASANTKIGTNSDAAVEISGSGTIFGRLRAIIDNYLDNSSYGLGKIYADMAKESSVKTNVGGTDYTAIGELRDNNHGLSALLAKLAQIIADIGTIQTETEILSLPNAARIDIVTPEQSSGAISNLQIHANVMYHLGDLTALSLIMVEPSDLTIYNEFVVCFFCQTGFTLQITHWDANTQVLFNSGATCEAGHYYILSVVDNLALLAKF